MMGKVCNNWTLVTPSKQKDKKNDKKYFAHILSGNDEVTNRFIKTKL